MIRLFAPLEEEYGGQLSLYVSGSWGEKRLTTSSDQDHLIITELNLSDKEIQSITEQMKLVALEIEKLGLIRCDAQMMASNPRYIFKTQKLTSLNPVDIIAVLTGRVLSGVDLRSESFYNYFHSAEFRKKLFRLLLTKFFTLFVTINPKKRMQIRKHLMIEEQYLFLSAKLPWQKRSLSTTQSFSILKNCIAHYESFFS